jgi:hypothetical protein
MSDAAKNLVELMLEGLRPNDKPLNVRAQKAVLDIGPALLDELLCRAFDTTLRPAYRVRLLHAISLLSPGHEQQIDCYDIDRFLDDPSPQVRRAGRQLHERIRAATLTATPPTSTMPTISTTQRNDAEDCVRRQLVTNVPVAVAGGLVLHPEMLCPAAH